MTSAARTEQLVVQRRQAEFLSRSGYKVYMLVSDNGEREVVDDIEYVPIGYVKGGFIKRFFQLSKKMKKVAHAIDADAYQTETPDFLAICRTLKSRGKKVFFNMLEGHPYTLYSKLHMPRFISNLIVNGMVDYMKRILKKIDFVFAVSDDIMEYLDSWGVNNKMLLGNYPEVNKDFHLSKEDYLKREPRVVYYGHIPKESRQELVFDAMSKIPGVRYLLAGKFWNQSYLEHLKYLPYWFQVEFIDGFERKRLPEILGSCTISNVARDLKNSKSPNGSLGILKIFESMEAGLPLILPDLPVYRQMVEKYNCGVLVDINDSSSIEKGIRYLTDNKELAYRMGQNGRNAVLSEYSWDHLSGLYLAKISS